MNHPIRVLIAGGGIGGLTLAQALRKLAINVSVYERDHGPEGWLQAYRIHIRPDAAEDLRRSLPAEIWQGFLASTGVPPTGLVFADEHLSELARLAPTGGRHGLGYPVSRVTLRNVLLRDLTGVIHFDKGIERYVTTPDGVEVIFADGSSTGADVLIGADGVHSTVRQQLLPQASLAEEDVVSIAGQFPLHRHEDPRLPRQFIEEMSVVLPPSAFALFIAQFVSRPATSGAPPAGPGEPMRDHVFWALAAHSGAITADRRQMSRAQLHAAAVDLTSGCHPAIRRLVTESDPESINTVRTLSSGPVSPWQAGRVTLLGDAIHTMTPFQGLGGNTAIRDAALLARLLADVEQGRRELLDAVHSYEESMRGYGFRAVERSLRAARYAASTNVLGRRLFRTGLRAVNNIPPLKSRLLAA